ncbi:MAG: hypothetical protein FJ295_12900 [Planctomycetes bacterium]|nr:hypothetical protein [Planctomycetota bacterium]
MSESQSRPLRSPFQFSIRGLLLFTTVVAVLLGLALTVSIGASLFGLIVALAAANCWGLFDHLQSGPRRKLVFGAAWIGFAVALMLPAVNAGCSGGGSTSLYGWQTAYYALCAQPETFMETVTATSPAQAANSGIGFYCYAQMNAANLMLILVPILMLRWRLTNGIALFHYWAVTGVPALGYTHDHAKDLLLGFYVWVLTHALLVTVMPLSAMGRGPPAHADKRFVDRCGGTAVITGLGLVQLIVMSIFGL